MATSARAYRGFVSLRLRATSGPLILALMSFTSGFGLFSRLQKKIGRESKRPFRRRSSVVYCAYFARNNQAGPGIPHPAFLRLNARHQPGATLRLRQGRRLGDRRHIAITTNILPAEYCYAP